MNLMIVNDSYEYFGLYNVLRSTNNLNRSTSKIVEWWKKKRAKRTKNVLQCPMC